MLFDRIQGGKDQEGKHTSIRKTALGVFAIAAIAVLSLLLRADYTVFAVIAVFLFYVLRQKHPLIRTGVGITFLALTRTMGYYCATGFSFIPLALYNGKKGKGLKWFFMSFTNGLPGRGTAANFSSDDSSFTVSIHDDGEAYLDGAVTVTFDSDGGSEVEAQTVVTGRKAVRPEDPAKAGFTFKDWYQVTDADTGTLAGIAFDFENTAVSESITLKAVWEESSEDTVIIKSANVEFQGKIRLQFAFSFPEDVLADEGAYVTFEKAGTITKKLVSEGTAGADSVSFFISVPAPEYADDIVVRAFDGEDSRLTLRSVNGTDYTENCFAYSVRTYAQNKSQSFRRNRTIKIMKH